jgi:hypothetical protein
MSTQALYSMPEARSLRELGSTGEMRPGLRYVQPTQDTQAEVEPASGAWLWAVAVALAIGAAALRAFY